MIRCLTNETDPRLSAIRAEMTKLTTVEASYLRSLPIIHNWGVLHLVLNCFTLVVLHSLSLLRSPVPVPLRRLLPRPHIGLLMLLHLPLMHRKRMSMRQAMHL
jgi:hypothetical protein